MKRKLIASAVSLAMLFTTAFCGIGAPVYADTASPEKPVSQDMKFYRDSETGHIYTEDIDPDYKTKSNVPASERATPPASWPTTADGGIGGIEEIKTIYPATRQQHPFGLCWDFASTALAEFDMITDGHGTKNNTDYSELQLAYFQYHTQNDKLGGLDGDTVTTNGTTTIRYNNQNITVPNYLMVGGNFIYAMQTLSQWKTYSSENFLPYSIVLNNPFISLSHYDSDSDQAKVTDIRFLDIKGDRNAVKQAIMNNGAVFIAYNSKDSNYSTDSYGATLYYQPYASGTNHDVVVVGWDDNFSRYRFPESSRPEGNGAWIVRNSWSTSNASSSSSTYFYMSYYDKGLAQTAYSADFAPGTKYDNLYQHDGSISHGTLTTTGVANVFTAQGPNSAVSEELVAVMLPFTATTNVHYKIEVYTGWQSATNPGQLHSVTTTEGYTMQKGIYTVPLRKSVVLAPGEKYAVVVTSLDGSVPFDMENTVDKNYTDSNGVVQDWFYSKASIDPGESFIVKNGVWEDIYYKNWTNYGNICIKAITNKSYTKKYTVTYNMNGGINNSANPSGYLATESGSVALKNPTRSGYHFVGWYSDSAMTKKVTSINRNNKYNQVLYARWCSDSNSSKTQVLSYATTTNNGSYKTVCSSCGQVKASGTSYKASSVKMSYAKLVYNGNKRSPVPVIKTSNGETLTNGTDYTFKYNQTNRSKVGRYSVKITFKGRYSGSKTLWFSIVPKAPASASAKLYGYNDIKVSWSKCTGAAGYYVYYKKSSASTYSNYKRVTGTSVKFANLAGNTKYNFKIIPYFNSSGTKYKSSKSKIVSTTTLKQLKQPTMFRNSDGSVKIRWNLISGASGYQVYWGRTKNGTYYHLSTHASNVYGTNFTVGKGVTYWYKVRAFKTVDGKKIYGPWSVPRAFTR